MEGTGPAERTVYHITPQGDRWAVHHGTTVVATPRSKFLALAYATVQARAHRPSEVILELAPDVVESDWLFDGEEDAYGPSAVDPAPPTHDGSHGRG